MPEYSRAEIEAHFARWREAVDRHDLDAMAPMLTEDARWKQDGQAEIHGEVYPGL